MQSDSPTPKANITELISQLIASRQITMTQYHQLSSVVMADGSIDEQERRQINRLFDAIQNGMVKFIG